MLRIPIAALPQAKASEEGIGIVAPPATLGQLFQFLDLAPSQNHFIGFEGGDQARHYVRDILSPSPPPIPQ